jgi:hypothetical protein
MWEPARGATEHVSRQQTFRQSFDAAPTSQNFGRRGALPRIVLEGPEATPRTAGEGDPPRLPAARYHPAVGAKPQRFAGCTRLARRFRVRCAGKAAAWPKVMFTSCRARKAGGSRSPRTDALGRFTGRRRKACGRPGDRSSEETGVVRSPVGTGRSANATRTARILARRRASVIEIAGLDVSSPDLLEPAARLTDAGHVDTAAYLLIADACGEERIGLTIRDREAVLAVLRDPPDGLCELRVALLSKSVGRNGVMA